MFSASYNRLYATVSIICWLVVGVATGKLYATGQVEQSFHLRLQSFLEQHCIHCHGTDAQENGLRLDTLPFDLDDLNRFAIWTKVHDYLREDRMPPADEPRPPVADRRDMVTGLEERLHQTDVGRQRDLGRIVWRRLNRVQYENTLRDLLSLPHLKVKELLPEDTSAAGFNNVGQGLGLSSVHIQRYLEAADAATEQAIARYAKPEKKKVRLSYRDERRMIVQLDYPVIKRDDDLVMLSREFQTFKPALSQYYAPFPGTYRIRIRASGWQTDKLLPMAVVAGQHFLRTRIKDSHLLGYFDVPPDRPVVTELTARLELHDYVRVFPPTLPKIRFARIRQELKHNYDGPGLAVQWVEIEGPFIETWPPESHHILFNHLPIVELPESVPSADQSTDTGQIVKELVSRWGGRLPTPPKGPRYTVASDQPRHDAQRLLANFIPKAFRRPISTERIQPYVELVYSWLDKGSSFEEAMKIGYQAVLSSTDFLFFNENPGPLDDYALASRLSYFLWNSMPDASLLDLAAQGKLREPSTLHDQVERLLDDPKSQRFIRDFVGQWLDLELIDFTMPDEDLYPEFDDHLQHSMVRETETFFEQLLREDLSVINFIDSDFSMLNGRLARHYGIDGVEGVALRRVSLPDDSHRGGVLTHGSVLKVTANGTVTSPVLRGVWVLDNLLGRPADPPPPNVPAIEPDIRGATTIREQLARHRADQSCAVCHQHIDPTGFALENFDVIGGWRDNYRSLEVGTPVRFRVGIKFRTLYSKYRIGAVVLAGDQLSDGRRFETIDEFKQLLLEDKDQIASGVATKLLIYATGGVQTFADRRLIERIVSNVKPEDYGLRSLIHEIVASEAFLNK